MYKRHNADRESLFNILQNVSHVGPYGLIMLNESGYKALTANKAMIDTRQHKVIPQADFLEIQIMEM